MNYKKHRSIEENIIIRRPRRTKALPKGRRSKPRTIFLKFDNYKDKVKVLQNAKKRKGTSITTNKDFSQENLSYRKELCKEMKQLRSEGKLAHLNYRTIVC